jgi:hypothetical protein
MGESMTHRIAYLKPDRTIYKETEVPIDRTMAEIKTMLVKNGCSRIGIQDDMRGKFPLYTLIFEKDSMPYMIEFPVVYERRASGDRLNMNLSGRIIRDRIKALLMEVEIGMSPFPAAMAQFVAIADRSTGQPTQMENYIAEHPKEIPSGMLFLPGGRS